MNIIVKPYGSELCHCRPDTTWERENKDYYVPDCVDSLHWTPIIFVRISKAGKCIGDKFVSRYYDSFNFGVLIYCRIKDKEELMSISCADHTSLLPAPLYNPVVMDNEDAVFEVFRNEERIFGGKAHKSQIEEAVCKASRLVSLRTGDFVAVELSDQHMVASRSEGEVRFSATFCEKNLFDLKLIF